LGDVDMAKEWYTVQEFAKEIGVSRDRVYEWLRSGHIKHLERITLHSIWRIPKTEVDRVLGREEGPQSRGETVSEEKTREAYSYNREIFDKSEAILNELEFENFFKFLSRNSFLASHLTRVLQFLEYFDSESNKYADSNLNYVNLKLCHNLLELSESIQIDSVERTRIQGMYDNYREKSVDNGWSLLLRKLLENTSDNVNAERDELYLIVDRFSHNIIYVPEFSDIFNYEHYIEWQQSFDSLVTNTRTTYKEYRAAIRETLFL